MVRMIPNYELQDPDFNGSKGEDILFREFNKLDDEYIIFHSIDWTSKNNKKIVDGEADFLIFNKNHGLLSLEVKHGGIKGKEGNILQVNRKTKQEKFIDPMFQADKSTYKIRDIVKSLNLKESIPIRSMVWLTGVKSNDVIGNLPLKYLKNENTFFSEHMYDVKAALETCYKYYEMKKQKFDKLSISKIVDKIAPEFHAIPSMSNIIEENNYYFNRMTNEQSFLLDYLQEQEEAAVQGAAGTGKTILAVEKARRLSESDNVVFLCFNKLLVEFLKNQYNDELPNVTFTNLFSLAAKALKKEKVNNEDIYYFLNNIESYPDVWDFKHIVIDEGQDFTDTSINLLREIAIVKESSFYVFFDKNQVIQQRDNLEWIKEMDCKLLLSRNCRNTMKIAKTSTKPIGISEKKLKMKIPIDGKEPYYFKAESQQQLINWLEKRIRAFTNEGVKKSQITIITTKTIETSVLNDVTKIGNYSITNKPNHKHILFTTARKFKGLESDVIFIVDIDKETFYNAENRMVFYVACSRAKTQLELTSLLTKEEEEEMIKEITESNDSRRIRLQTNLGVKLVSESTKDL
ncbi:nuclease-related domain-containing DEAD/DEAH box helicase [Staphylococcus kloosii]|jgi:superfamily I DNA and RNA helicase|uniref:nuclease-related domain-containing DEAD/DEAH box helicase n=1 Tax=Staphylococcus kloosii TaxID=29384 RepID=UPI00189D95D1|nr:NERD domain-containing protein [Staphylococcus kloosii]MBF7030179.1 ATP-binding domain-containing protein [Staphylococcus kloosii]